MYNAIVQVLAKSGRSEAVPLLKEFQSGNLPPLLQADLDVAAASKAEWSDEGASFEDWQRQSQWEHDRFRMACALAIADLSVESPVSFLEGLLAEWTPIVANELKQGKIESDLMRFEIDLCKQLTTLGSKAGIDAVLMLTELPNGIAKFPGVSLLKVWTGQTFGPEYDDSDATKAAEIQKWKQWWAAHRENYRADVRNIQSVEPRLTPYPAPLTLREHLVHAESAPMDYDAQYMGKQSIKWLEENAARNSRKLREIVKDEEENLSVRAEALKWYVKASPNSAYPLALECLKRHSSKYHDALCAEALHQIRDTYPAKLQDAIKDAIMNRSGAAAYAVREIEKTPRNLALIQDALPSLDVNARSEALQVLLAIDPPPLSAIESALLQPEVFAAARAGRIIRESALESSLSGDATVALDQWLMDPLFLLECTEFKREKDVTLVQFEEVLNIVSGDSPRHAYAYLRARNRLHDIRIYAAALQANPAGTDRVEHELMARFLQCVKAYWAWQGRTDHMPAYSLQ